jgi:hypothetical protein
MFENKVFDVVVPKMVKVLGIPTSIFKFTSKKLKPGNPAAAWCTTSTFRGLVDAEIFYDMSQIETPEKLASMIAHELTHVKQWYTRDMRDVSDNVRYFQGKHYPKYRNGDSFYEYLVQPWEIEARGMEEVGLYFWEQHEAREKRMLETKNNMYNMIKEKLNSVVSRVA